MRLIIVAGPDSPRLAEAERLGHSVQLMEGPLDSAEQGLLWMAIGRAAPEGIWVDWTALTPPDVELIRQFRVLHATRVVVELPADAQPPDAALSALISLGIWDVAGTEDAMEAVWARHPTYGDVARWHHPTLEAGPRSPGGLADPEIAAAQTIAVVSGKGGVGKTSFVANCLVAAAAWGAIGIDADYVKPSLDLAFRAPDAEAPQALDRLLGGLTGSGETWTDRDRQVIREWVRGAAPVVEGVRLIAGPDRARAVLPVVPPGLVTALAEASARTARLTLIDTPGSTMEPSWVEAVMVADWIVLVTTPEYSAVLESIDVLRKLEYLRIPRTQVWLVVSHRGKAGYSTTELTTTHLPLPLLAEIPDQPARWHQAWAHHHPPALKDRKVWQGIVEKMTGVTPDRPRSARPFRLRRRRRT